MRKSRQRFGRVLAIASFVMTLGLSPIAIPSASAQLAENDNPFSALVGKRRERKPRKAQQSKIERYVLASDDRSFLFEDRGAEARIQFLCGDDDTRIECRIDPEGASPEIYLLTATRAPRGDVIYKNAEGEVLLRIASYGGATVYWPGEFQGSGASKSFGDNRALALGDATFLTAQRRAQNATAMISAAAGAPVVFDFAQERFTPPMQASGLIAEASEETVTVTGARVQRGQSKVLADAVMTAAKGIHIVARDSTGAAAIAENIARVRFFQAVEPGVALNGAVLEIRYVPDGGLSGRPSPAAVARFLEETL